jgi:hypothetical protein
VRVIVGVLGRQLGRRWYLSFGPVLSWLGVLIVMLLRRSEREQLA